jgi:putative transposase
MKDWMTAAEIAAAALPELPSTRMGVSLLAERERWAENPAYARKREGKGGGFEYHFRLLPTLAQVEYMQRHMAVTATTSDLVAVSDAAEAAPHNLTGRAREERDARLAIVAAFERFAAGLPRLRQASHLQLFTDKYDMGTLAIDGWVKDLIPSIGKRTLQRWLADKKAGRVDALAVDRGQARKGTGVLDVADNGKVRTLILALLAQNAHYSAAHIRGEVLALMGPQLWVPYKGSGPDMLKAVPVPPIRTFQHFIAALKSENKVALLKLTDPDRYRSTMAPSGVGALQHIQRPNQLWQIDASPVDALCVDGRHSVYVCIDIFTRRAVLLISRTPKAAAVAQLLRKAILAWGIPEAIKTDNGSDFVAHDTKRLMLSLGIEHQLSDAYSPQQKGHVERFIGTFQRDFSTIVPGFVGHNPADRKAIENRKSFAKRLGETEAETFGVTLTGPDLQRFADGWVDTMYGRREHSSLQGRSPQQMYAACNFRARVVDIRALDMLLMPVAGKNGIRTTTKFGLRINDHHYATANILPGQMVLVRQDPEDMGRVYAYEPDGGRYLGEGICARLAGVNPAALMKATRQLQGELLAETVNPVRKMLRELAKGPAPIERALRLAADQAPDNVVSLPDVVEAHTTLQIEAALAAMETIAGVTPSLPLDDATAAEHRRMVAHFQAEEAEAHDFTAFEAKQADYEAERAAAKEIAAGRGSASLDAMLGLSGSGRGAAQARADVEAYGAAMDDLRAKYNPLFALERQHEANLEGMFQAYRLGAISTDEWTAAVQREKAAHLAATAALDGHTHAANMNIAANGRAMAQRANLIFQLNDIFVSLASGQNLALVAIQQGSQIATIYGPGEGGIGAAFRETGNLAVGAAAKFWPVALAAAAIGVAVGGMRHEIEETSGVSVSFGDTFLAVFQVLGGYLYDNFRPQIEAIRGWWEWTWQGVIDATKWIGNGIISRFNTAFVILEASVKSIPDMFLVAGEEAANFFIDGIEQMVRDASSHINNLMAPVNAIRAALKQDPIQLIDPASISLPPVDIGGAAAAERLAAGWGKVDATLKDIAVRDYMGEFFGDVQQQAIANYNAGLDDTSKKAKNAALNVNDLKEAAKAFEQEVSFYRGTFSGFFEDMRKGLMEGKTFWEALGNAGANALDRIAQRAMNMAADGLFDMIFGALMSGITGSAPGFVGGGNDSWGPLFPNAKGNVISSPSLSAYSNQVHDTPKLFAFANGAGVFAEAGPEAIMPLARTGSGDLGVRLVGGAGWSINFNPVTHITIGANSNVSKSEIEQLLDERDRTLMEQFNGKVMDVLDNPRRAA